MNKGLPDYIDVYDPNYMKMKSRTLSPDKAKLFIFIANVEK